jgi:hypothetical protein
MKIAASNSASITGTIQFGPTLNRAGNSSSTIIASTRAAASCHRFSAPIPVRTTSILDESLRCGLPRRWDHQSRMLASACAVGGARSATVSASVISA